MRLRRSVVPLVMFLLGAVAPAFAQRTTGTLVGNVTDESGAALPGVTVTLKGETVVGAQTAVTNEQGFYRFAALPTGNYDVAFALGGFATLNRNALKVSVGATVDESVMLKVSSLQEEVTVTGEAPVVDTTTNQISTTYDKDWVRNAPIPRNSFFDLINVGARRRLHLVRRVEPADLVRLGHQRELVPARRHRLHGAHQRRLVAVSQHRRDRGDRGAVARRHRRVRQRAGRRVQHRDPPGLEHVQGRRDRLLPERRPHRQQHERRTGRAASRTTATSTTSSRARSAGRS